MTTRTRTDHLPLALDTATITPVFPCLVDKRPACPGGFKAATSDPERITRWWTKHPDHLVAIPTAGYLVVDLDRPKAGDGRHPDTAWQAWDTVARPHGWTPEQAAIVETPSGGWHIYHQDPTRTIRNSASRLGPLIDVRATGGYVIAPGSTLPDGRSYQLRQPHPGTIPTAPTWLINACTTTPPGHTNAQPPPTGAGGTTYGLRALEAELGRLALAPQGGRNEALNRAAYRSGQLVAGGQLDLHHATGQLLAVALRIGLTEAEAVATARSGLEAGTRNPRSPRP